MTEMTLKCPICGEPYVFYSFYVGDQSACQQCRAKARERTVPPSQDGDPNPMPAPTMPSYPIYPQYPPPFTPWTPWHVPGTSDPIPPFPQIWCYAR